MSIECRIETGIIYSTITGCLTDDELLAYYKQPVFISHSLLWRELIDGRDITEMAVSKGGLAALADYAVSRATQLRGGRVAMVASTDITYGMFRMWEMVRVENDYEVRVFREMRSAREWLFAV